MDTFCHNAFPKFVYKIKHQMVLCLNLSNYILCLEESLTLLSSEISYEDIKRFQIKHLGMVLVITV